MALWDAAARGGFGGGGDVWIGNVASKHPWCWRLAGCAGPAPPCLLAPVSACWAHFHVVPANPASLLQSSLPFSPAPPTSHLPHHSSVFTVAILSLFYVCLWFVPLWHVWTAYFMCVCGLFLCGMFEQHQEQVGENDCWCWLLCRLPKVLKERLAECGLQMWNCYYLKDVFVQFIVFCWIEWNCNRYGGFCCIKSTDFPMNRLIQ